MIKKDQKGQVSAELILMVGFIFVVVLAIATYVGQENEPNLIAVAAKEGAMEAISNQTLISSNIEPITVQSLNIIGDTDITIQMKLSGSLSSYNDDILDSIYSHIEAQGYKRDTKGTANMASDDQIQTGMHTYTVVLI